MKPNELSLLQKFKNLCSLAGTLVVLLSWNADNFLGQITVDKIVNPDNIPPIISFSAIPAAVNGYSEITVEYSVKDDAKGQGISKATLYYS